MAFENFDIQFGAPKAPPAEDPFVGLLDNSGQSTNLPNPVDITGAITQGVIPAPQQLSPTGQFLQTLETPEAKSARESAALRQAQQQAIGGFMQSATGAQPLAPQVATQPLSPSAPSRDALGISQAPVPTPGSRVAEIGNVTEQIADKMGLVGAEREKFIREESQAQATKEAKAGIGARTIIKSLKERGMSEEDIKDAIGVTDGMTKEEAMRGLSKLQKREDAKLSGTAGEQRAIDKINQAATYDPETGEPTNDAGIAEGFINDFLGAEADPDSDMTLGDYMTDSQKREFGRFKDRAARGRLKKDDIGRMTRFKEQAMKKAETKFARAQAKAQKAELNQARRNAKSAEQKTWLGALTAENKLIETQLKEYADASTKDKKELMNPEQHRGLLNRRGEITGSLANFNKNGVMDGAQTAQAATAPAATHKQANDSAKESGSKTYTLDGQTFVVQ